MTTLTFHTYPLPYAATAATTSVAASALSTAASSASAIPHLIVAAQGEDSDDDAFDPNFFDQDYSIAAQTAFSVWEGAAFLLQFLQRTDGQGANVAAALRNVLHLDPSSDQGKRAKVVELGSGTGAAGIGLAMLGAEVLCTDIKSVTGNICANIQRNAAAGSSTSSSASWLGNLSTCVGNGYAAAQPLNWMQPLDAQRAPLDPCAARVVLATETTWLRELVEPFVGCASELLASAYPTSPTPRTTPAAADQGQATPPIIHHLLATHADRKFLLWVYKERGTDRSQTFTTWPLVNSEFERRGCRVVTVHREQSGEDEGQWVRVNVVVKAQEGDDAVRWE